LARGKQSQQPIVTSLLHMLLGAALIVIGVLTAALADRIRGLRASREIAPRARPAVIPMIKDVEQGHTKVTTARTGRYADDPEDVITVLVTAGYTKQIATEATRACSGVERATIEGWTRAALRRCTRGVS
jgi:hypothetical protein